MTINFKCKGCHQEFDCDVGRVSMSGESEYPTLSKAIVCPECGERKMDEVELTELGQLQMTEAFLAG